MGLDSDRRDAWSAANERPFFYLVLAVSVFLRRYSGIGPKDPHGLVMTRHLVASVILGLGFVTSACGASMKTPDIRQNPHPTQRHEVTMTIDGAPSTFDSIESYVKYQVLNPKCVPMHEGSGATPTIERSVLIPLKKVGEHSFTGTFYSDLLQDEDYFGMGLCHWAVVAAGVKLRAKSVIFSPDISTANIESQKSEVVYFAKDSFSARSASSDIEVGSEATPFITQHPDKFFSVTLRVRENIK